MKLRGKVSPPKTKSLAAGVLEGEGGSALWERLNRYSKAKKRAMANIDVLSVFGNNPITTKRCLSAKAKLCDCGNYLKFNHYYTVNETRLGAANFCKQHLLCPLCAIRRSSKALGEYLKRYEVIRKENPDWRLSMITVTVANGPDLEERFNHLTKGIKVVMDRRRDWLKKGRGKTEWRKVHGWVGSYEVTNIGNGWHPHVHIMTVHSESYTYKAMNQEWLDVTGDSHVINVKPIFNRKNPTDGFMEIFKYAMKFSSLSPEENVHAWNVLRGRRLQFSGGCFRGVKVPEDLTDQPLDGLPYIEMLFQYFASGYVHINSEHKEPEHIET